MGLRHPEVVLDVFFSYLGEVRHRGVDMGLYRTLAKAARLQWDWTPPASPDDDAPALAEAMTQDWPRTALLSGNSRIDEPDGDLVGDLVSKLGPNNMNVGLELPAAGKTNATRSKNKRGGRGGTARVQAHGAARRLQRSTSSRLMTALRKAAASPASGTLP